MILIMATVIITGTGTVTTATDRNAAVATSAPPCGALVLFERPQAR